jgi:tRNA G18 (ribose-2'-O)-methylase SpoU
VRGYFGIGVYHPKTGPNVGTLLRSASAFGAAFVFTVGRRYHHQASDTCNTPRHVPLYHHLTVDDLAANLPHGCQLVGVELAPAARPLSTFTHPHRACYLLGAEDYGLPPAILYRCHLVVEVDGGHRCLNVAAAGSIVLWDRRRKAPRPALTEAR